MSAPLDFLKSFAQHLRSAGIPFAITSGMACVHYGLQQNTKDSDWIIPANALDRFRDLLISREGDLPPWRISYRQIFGAPLEKEYMQHGWTSHLSVWDDPASVEHKVDIFSKPPRVKEQEIAADNEGWATQHVVAQMKKTDREKDWPILKGLGRQLWERQNTLALLHLADPEPLLAAWRATSERERETMARRRPLLRLLGDSPVPEPLKIERLLLLEHLLWEKINAHRHECFTRAWKDFYRRWRAEENWEWVTDEQFRLQHQRLVQAVHNHKLPPNPLGAVPREELLHRAIHEVAVIGGATQSELAELCPPVEEVLP